MSFLTDSELAELGLKSYGEHVRISSKCSFYGTDRISIGNNVRIDDFCVLSAGEGGISIGSYIHIAVFSSLIGKSLIRLDDFANLSSRVSIYSSTDDFSGASLTNPTIPEAYTHVTHADVSIGRHVIVGAGTVVLPGVVIEEGCAVGALSLVKSSCSKFGIYAGVPVRWVGERSRQILDVENDFLHNRV